MRQRDKFCLSPLSVSAGDRVYLWSFVPTPGRSPKLCFPWLERFRVIAVDHFHLTIVLVTSPQSPPNQVKKCFELSGSVFTSPQVPLEKAALTNQGASIVSVVRYNHEISSTQQSSPCSSVHATLRDSFQEKDHLASTYRTPVQLSSQPFTFYPFFAYPPIRPSLFISLSVVLRSHRSSSSLL